MLVSELRRQKREEWAKIHNKKCFWCGKHQHEKEGGFCQHPFSQTWVKGTPDTNHFEEWLQTTNYKEQLHQCSNN